MTFPRPSVDIRAPPADLDDLIDWFDRVSTNLVLLEEYPRPAIRRAIDRLERGVREHVASFDARLTEGGVPPGTLADARAILRADHAWFSISIEQLEWFFEIVERDDHGGHRQALGQYGRVFAEALRRHRSDERAYLGPSGTGSAGRRA
ncbi:MAG: hypothetical protein ACRECT_06190 [Thermoplasmata archaeon]